MADAGHMDADAANLESGPVHKFRPSEVQAIIREALEERLKDQDYDAEECPLISRELVKVVQDRVKELGYERYKFVTQIVIAEVFGQGVRVASRCLWDPETDNFASATFANVRCYAAVWDSSSVY